MSRAVCGLAEPPPLLCGLPDLPHVDRAHSLQVTRMALTLFDDLAGPLRLASDGRDLLAAGAYWHDSGQALGERGHHKRSFALILALDLPEFGAVRQTQIACIARYHRKALPSPAHDGYGALPGEAQRQVRQLAAILRVADGLDYTHGSVVHTLAAWIEPEAVTLDVWAPEAAQTEICRAEAKADLFRLEFARTLLIRRCV